MNAETVGDVHTSNSIKNKKGIKAFDCDTKKVKIVICLICKKINKLIYVKTRHRKLACSFCA